MARIDAFFRLMNSQGASDLHMMAGSPPCLRVRGDIEPVKYHELSHDELMSMLAEITPEHKMKVFQETGDVDFAYELPGLSRYRANYFRQAHGVGAVFRQIPAKIMTIDQLGLPSICRRFAMMEKGLVLVTGPTGSGKSTTLAAIIDYANRNRRDHIITVEDPIEFKHTRNNCLINQREIGPHTQSFSAALRGALREDPDVIMVGEMRDLETISLALEAASTGHLVLATLHTQSATRTIDRVIDVFPADAQDKVRSTLADSIKGVLCQTLIKRCDKGGSVAAMEIMVGTPAIAHNIREGKTHQLPNLLQTGKKSGMRTMDDSLEEFLRQKIISPSDAFEACNNKEHFVRYLPRIPEEWSELLEEQAKTRRQQAQANPYRTEPNDYSGKPRPRPETSP